MVRKRGEEKGYDHSKGNQEVFKLNSFKLKEILSEEKIYRFIRVGDDFYMAEAGYVNHAKMAADFNIDKWDVTDAGQILILTSIKTPESFEVKITEVSHNIAMRGTSTVKQLENRPETLSMFQEMVKGLNLSEEVDVALL